MLAYARPKIDAPLFHDEAGEVIDFGNRWGTHSPPEDTYSVTTHAERFRPLHTIGDALIAHLTEAFDVLAIEDPAFTADLRHDRNDAVRAVRVTPNDPHCAGLTFVFTSYPGVILHAGLLHDFPYPRCGCDACDESCDAQATDMERLVLAVTEGRYRESIHAGSKPWIDYAITSSTGSQSARSRARDESKERVRAAKATLKTLPNGWAAWPERLG